MQEQSVNLRYPLGLTESCCGHPQSPAPHRKSMASNGYHWSVEGVSPSSALEADHCPGMEQESSSGSFQGKK